MVDRRGVDSGSVAGERGMHGRGRDRPPQLDIVAGQRFVGSWRMRPADVEACYHRRATPAVQSAETSGTAS